MIDLLTGRVSRIRTFIYRNSETILRAIIIDMECAKSSLLEEREGCHLENEDGLLRTRIWVYVACLDTDIERGVPLRNVAFPS